MEEYEKTNTNNKESIMDSSSQYYDSHSILNDGWH
jgi:hypothetical protein